MSKRPPKFIEDAEPVPQITHKLTELIERVYFLDAAIKDMESQLERDKRQRHELLSKEIPEEMATVGTNVFGVPGTDAEVRIVPYYHAVLPKEMEAKQRGIAWLEENEYGDIINREMVVTFNKEHQEQADRIFQRVKQMLVQEEIAADTVLSMHHGVHWATLTSAVREMIEVRRMAVPLDILGATAGTVAKIERKR